MSDNNIRRRFPVSRRTSSRALKPSPSGRRRFTPVPVNRRSSKQHRDTNYKALERSKSEPCVLKIGFVDFEDDDPRDTTAQSMEILFRPQTCSDLFVSPDYLISGAPPSFEVIFLLLGFFWGNFGILENCLFACYLLKFHYLSKFIVFEF